MEAAVGDEEDDIGLHFGGEFEDSDDAVRAGDALAGGGDHAGFHPFIFNPGGGRIAIGLGGGDEFLAEGFVVSGELDKAEAGGDREFFDEFDGFEFDFLEGDACFFSLGFDGCRDIEHEKDALAVGLDAEKAHAFPKSAASCGGGACARAHRLACAEGGDLIGNDL